jgi:integration host factor subunit alpha
MTLTKAEMIEKISAQTGLTRKKATETIETVLEIMKEALASGEDVLTSGFGKFCVRDKSERKGRNPATGDEILLPPRRVVTFKSSGKLRNRVNSK